LRVGHFQRPRGLCQERHGKVPQVDVIERTQSGHHAPSERFHGGGIARRSQRNDSIHQQCFVAEQRKKLSGLLYNGAQNVLLPQGRVAAR
jgi:hypothetical protein